jgi:hypothetical protein
MSSNYLINARNLEAFLLQIIEQPHTQRRLVVATYPAPYEFETPPKFYFCEKMDPDLVAGLREAIINVYQQQITRDLTRHYGMLEELKAREKEMAREESKQINNQLDMFQVKEQALHVFDQATGNNDEKAPF